MLIHILGLLTSLSASQNIGVAAVVIEAILRLAKTNRPLSLLWMAADGLRVIAQIAGKCAELLDKVLPQRLK